MKIKSLKISTLFLSLCELMVGILLVINPLEFTSIILVALGVLSLFFGIVNIIRYFKEAPEEASWGQNLTRGLLGVTAGLFFIFQGGWFVEAFPLLTELYGVLILITGTAKVQWAVDLLRMKIKNWFLAACSAVLTLVCVLVIFWNPFGDGLWMFIAITLIVQAVFDFVTAVFAKEEWGKSHELRA